MIIHPSANYFLPHKHSYHLVTSVGPDQGVYHPSPLSVHQVATMGNIIGFVEHHRHTQVEKQKQKRENDCYSQLTTLLRLRCLQPQTIITLKICQLSKGPYFMAKKKTRRDDYSPKRGFNSIIFTFWSASPCISCRNRHQKTQLKHPF